MKTIAILNAKGGVGKTAISHLLSRVLGEVGYSVFLLHSDARDEEAPSSLQNRPYLTWALRSHLDPEQATRDYFNLRESIRNIENAIMIIDGGANRRKVDELMSEAADLVIVPVGISDGDMTEARATRERVMAHRRNINLPLIPVKYALSNWPGERKKLEVVAKARHVARFYRDTEGQRYETIVTNMPSIIGLMDPRQPAINNTLRRVGRELADEVCKDLDIVSVSAMLKELV